MTETSSSTTSTTKNHPLIGEATIHPESLRQMREIGGKWAAFQNQALDSADVGSLRYLKYGEGCTYATPPAMYPDSSLGVGWRYLRVGYVDLATGAIVTEEPRS